MKARSLSILKLKVAILNVNVPVDKSKCIFDEMNPLGKKHLTDTI